MSGRTRPIVLVSSGRSPYHPRHYQLLARALQDGGLPVVVASPPGRGNYPGGPVCVRLLPLPRSRVGRFASGAGTMLRVARMRPSAVQVNNIDLLPWAVLARGLLKVPVLYDSNEDYASYMLIKEYLPPNLRRALSRLVGWVEPLLAKRLDAVLTADRGTAEAFSRSWRHEGAALVIHNFPRRALTDHGTAAEPVFDVTYHGSLPSYHVERIVAVAHLLRARGARVRWCIAALSHGEAERRALERRLDCEGLRDDFTLFYDLAFEQIPGLLAETRVGFIPLPDRLKFHRNLPMKLFEFMALGRPAVASDLPPIRQLVGDGECCLLVPPDDDEGYAAAIARLLADDTLAARLGARGRELIRNGLHAETEVQPYVDLVRRLVSQPVGLRERSPV